MVSLPTDPGELDGLQGVPGLVLHHPAGHGLRHRRPLVPKITAAPVPMPKGISGDSPSSSANRMPDSLIIVMISWVVSTRSTSGYAVMPELRPLRPPSSSPCRA